LGDGPFARLDLRPENELLGDHHLGHDRVQVGLDGGILRLEIQQWDFHTKVISCRAASCKL